MKIGTITSGLMSRGNSLSPPGKYELDIEIDDIAFKLSPDKGGLVKHVIAEHIAHCARFTGVPTMQGLWHVEVEPWVSENFSDIPRNFPA